MNLAATADPFARIAVGAEARLSHRVSDADIEAFTALSGDTNPVHTDDGFARALGFRARILHGVLSAAFVSRVIGTMLPGPGVLCLSQSFKFLLPIYAGDRIEVVVRVVHKSEATRSLVLAGEITRQGEKVMTAEAKATFPLAVE